MSFLALTALVVRDYDEALAFYVGMLGFELVEDTYIPEQESRIGNQTGGRVFLFLYTDDFDRNCGTCCSRRAIDGAASRMGRCDILAPWGKSRNSNVKSRTSLRMR